MALTPLTAKYHHDQASANVTWNIAHNLQVLSPLVDVWVDVSGTDTRIMPETVVVSDNNNVVLTFSVATAGFAVLR